MSSPESATDIAIVGAGIIGLSVAYYLVKTIGSAPSRRSIPAIR
jgi:predicted NAD/FAD-binding protein